MTHGLVSVVIVAHNNWPDLELATQSALCQSYQPVEVVVVDNDSSDGTEQEILARFGGQVTYHRQENRFEGGGRNTGLELSTGEYIQFLDADDFLAPDKIEKQVALFRTDPGLDVVYGDFRVFGSSEVVLEDGDTRDYDDLLLALLTPEGNGAGLLVHSALFRRAALESVGSWDETIPGSDQDYWLRAASSGCRFRHCPGALCFYQRRPGQRSSRAVPMLQEMEMTWKKALGYITGEPYRAILRSRLARVRFALALRDGLSRRDAIAMLKLARQTSPETISSRALAVGVALATVPAGRRLSRARGLRPVSALTKRWLHIERPTPPWIKV